MTPELRQAIQLLQMSALDLQAFVNTEIETNPLLEAEDQLSEETSPEVLPETGPQSVDVRLERFLPQPTAVGGDDFSNWTENLAGETSLREHLLDQISLIATDAKELALATILVNELDDDGYLRTSIFEISERVGATTGELERALDILQSCEPTGIAARNLGECYKLQMAENGALTSEMEAFLSRIDMIAETSGKEIRAALNLDPEAYGDILAQIKALNPAPGKAFDSGIVAYAVPDVFVARNNLGGWSVELNNSVQPSIEVNTQLAEEVAAEGSDEAEFIKECEKRADWLKRSIEQRSSSILRVAAEIVRVQEAFFSLGIAYLKPMTMREVAEELKVSESTVSRVTNTKYLHCERGTFELKFFFSQAIRSSDGAASFSALSVQERIRQLIDEEASDKVLSDDKIVQILKKSGIDIARRTVTKYREAMNIPSSVERRRFKANVKKIGS